ncbi:tyrosine-protein phosphatase [Actinokineospora sp. NBRC 105648]|uniref:tyrosine-protein phosphatase n=1 Tax=Actinokineospora sp. NBRC 105648 TaxID=3032206 RepID=UPI0024A416E9|nr:tyrosine-protein phosphatase [Actinokineospora sp. NBRC 105648]GLZ39577.1 protein-tyrosine-phosphatase [Actinokineospora sp. NBRC 105648]
MRHLPFARLHNFRDLGGYPARGGTVRWGLLYRSDSLGKLAGDDLARFTALGVRTVIDLRHAYEIEARGRVPDLDGLSYHHLPIEHRPYDQTSLGPDVDPGRYLADRYLEVAEDGAVELSAALEVIADAEGPAVFHCASGKDRTGVLAALVLNAIGVSTVDIVEDFARTGLATDRLLADWLAERPGSYTWPGYGRAPESAMRLFLADLSAAHGSVESYVAHHLRVAPATITSLHRRFVGR